MIANHSLCARIAALALILCGLGTFAESSEVESAPPGMAVVPAGRYTPLFRTETEPKEVAVQAFLLDVFPVTNGKFLKFVQANPKWRRSSVKRLFADQEYLSNWAADLEPGTNALPNAPVIFVSWFAAKAFAAWQDKRLPTTAEWEYAAAASPARPDGANDPDFIRQVYSWYSSPAPETLPSVGLGPANCYGLHDLHGLVWEWVADFNTAMATGDSRADSGLDRQLFCGGGSEGASDRSNFPAFMRYGFRSSLQASYTIHNLGFRCARNLGSSSK